MDAVVLHTEACPHTDLATRRVVEALATAGAQATVTSRLVATQADATRWGFAGSPTILVDGRDAFPATGRPVLACRLYPTEAGMEGAPSVAQLVAALTR